MSSGPKPSVSVVIPCYNVAGFVTETLESVFQQSHLPLEVIAIDNNSQDNTLEILKQLQVRFPKLVVDKEPKKGASAARNRGWKQAKGDWIQFLDADDVLLPGKLATQMKLVENQNDLVLVLGDHRETSEAGVPGDLVANDPTDLWVSLMRTRLGKTSAHLWKRSAVAETGGWNEELGSSQEYDLMFRMFKVADKVAFDSQPNTLIRRRSGSISNTNQASNWERYLALRGEMLRYLEARKPENLPALRQAMFDAVRIAFAFDREVAKTALKNFLPAGFKPQISEVTSGFYIRIYAVLGLSGAELIRKLVGR